MAKEEGAYMMANVKNIFALVNIFAEHRENHYSMEKFKWFPTECAPELYPMRIVKGDFIFKNEGSIYIPDRKTFHNGWGEIGSIHLAGEELKPLPNRLIIAWLSLTEDKFYFGDFDLPYDTIAEFFNRGFKSPHTNEKATYAKIIVGLAPGGIVAVWLAGQGIVTEVCFLKAKETNIDWKIINDDEGITRKQFIQSRLKEVLSAEELSLLSTKNIPFGLWENYRTRYPWELFIVGVATPKNIWLNYYNGEHEYINFSSNEVNEQPQRAVPKKFELLWTSSDEKKYSCTVYFNEEEIFEAFAKISASAFEGVKLQIQISDIDQSLRIYLQNEKYILELKRCSINVYLN